MRIAHTVWVTAALGIACGLGRWNVAAVGVAIAPFLLVAVAWIEALVSKGSER